MARMTDYAGEGLGPNTTLKVTLEIGRILLGLIFLLSGAAKLLTFNATAAFMAAKGIPISNVVLIVAALTELVGGLSILFGYHGAFFGPLLTVYLIPVTLIFHTFWAATGPDQQIQMANFLKNLAIMGGLIQYAVFQVTAERGLSWKSADFSVRILPKIPVTDS